MRDSLYRCTVSPAPPDRIAQIGFANLYHAMPTSPTGSCLELLDSGYRTVWCWNYDGEAGNRLSAEVGFEVRATLVSSSGQRAL
jgi:hypothetical protein